MMRLPSLRITTPPPPPPEHRGPPHPPHFRRLFPQGANPHPSPPQHHTPRSSLRATPPARRGGRREAGSPLGCNAPESGRGDGVRRPLRCCVPRPSGCPPPPPRRSTPATPTPRPFGGGFAPGEKACIS